MVSADRGGLHRLPVSYAGLTGKAHANMSLTAHCRIVTKVDLVDSLETQLAASRTTAANLVTELTTA